MGAVRPGSAENTGGADAGSGRTMDGSGASSERAAFPPTADWRLFHDTGGR